MELGDTAPFQSSTMVVPGSLQMGGNGTSVTYEAVDSAGNHYAVYFDGHTGDFLAASDSTVIRNQLTPEQLTIAQAKYADARTEGWIIVLPIVIGAGLCYGNDQITKNQNRISCEEKDGTVVVENSGMCGFFANYRCDVPEPRPPHPEPPDPPPPPGSIFGFHPNGHLGLIDGSNPLSRNTFDSDWFGCLSHSGCG